MTIRSPEFIQRTQDSMTPLIESSDELRDLDQVLGGDSLGATISAGVRTAIETFKAMPTEPKPAPSDVACAYMKTLVNANSPTMAALAAGDLLAGFKVWVGYGDVTTVEVETFIRAAASSVSRRGKSQMSDKTTLGMMTPITDSLTCGIEANPTVVSENAFAVAVLDNAITDAAEAMVTTRGLQSQHGHAFWLQDRSIDLRDPGTAAFLRVPEAWRDVSTDERGSRAVVIENF